MKLHLYKHLVFTLLAGSGIACLAGPINRADVPPDPLWVLHVDLDALRPTQIGQFLFDELAKPEHQAKFAALEMMFNFDPRRHLRAVTLYSTGPKPEDGVLLVYGEFEPGRLETLAKAANEYQGSIHGQHTIHSWVDAKRGNARRVYASIHGNRIAFGQQLTIVIAALDVMNGAASLRNSALFPSLTGQPTTSFIQVASRKLDLPESDPNSAILKLSKSLRFDLGEAGGRISAQIELQAGTEEVAGHLNSIAQGLLALAKLRTDKPGVVKLAEAAKLNQTGPAVDCVWDMPATDAVTMLKVLQAKATAKATSN